MTAHLTIVRHGTTEWMEQGLLHGQTDAPLSALGVSQAQAAGEALRGRKFDAFYSSPTGRAWQTAQIIAASVGMAPEPLEGLKEHNFGALEGTSARKFPSWLLFLRMAIGWQMPIGKDGESLASVYQRAGQFLDLMAHRHAGQDVLAVSHGGLINMLLRHISRSRFIYYEIQPASITEIDYGEDGKGRILTELKPLTRPRRR